MCTNVTLQGLTAENKEESFKGCRRVEHGYTRTRLYHLGEEFQPLSQTKPYPEAWWVRTVKHGGYQNTVGGTNNVLC